MLVKIRFNTDRDKIDQSLPPWRLLIEGKEHLVNDVRIEVPTWTTYDEVEPGRWKWHLTCEGTPTWDAQRLSCTIVRG